MVLDVPGAGCPGAGCLMVLDVSGCWMSRVLDVWVLDVQMLDVPVLDVCEPLQVIILYAIIVLITRRGSQYEKDR